ncbi:MAG: DUF123 domain-containing protein [Crenarchaeota archaeon]|nr:DUF123 domain-containing protein [Thermoproteota archaeon]
MKDILKEPGIYLLIISVEDDCKVTTRGRNIFNIGRGTYIYVGSALRGLSTRIKRYLEKKFLQKQHWHIDYLLAKCRSKIVKIICASLSRYMLNIRAEAALSFMLSSIKYLRPIDGFGATDVRYVRSNLYKIVSNKVPLEKVIQDLREILATSFGDLIEIGQQD